jgi:hypothetical protein
MSNVKHFTTSSSARSSGVALQADCRCTGSQFFHTFCLIDGVGDPEQFPVSDWMGLRIQPTAEDAEETRCFMTPSLNLGESGRTARSSSGK